MSPMDDSTYEHFTDVWRGESDRAAAILGAALLDAVLEELLLDVMVEGVKRDEIFEGTAPLSSFSAKIRIAYSLGLISAQERRDLDRIRKIRNDFAHSLDPNLSFGDPTVQNRARGLELPRFLLLQDPDSGGDHELRRKQARLRFGVALGMLKQIWETTSFHTEHAEEKEPPFGSEHPSPHELKRRLPSTG